MSRVGERKVRLVSAWLRCQILHTTGDVSKQSVHSVSPIQYTYLQSHKMSNVSLSRTHYFVSLSPSPSLSQRHLLTLMNSSDVSLSQHRSMDRTLACFLSRSQAPATTVQCAHTQPAASHNGRQDTFQTVMREWLCLVCLLENENTSSG